MEGTQPLEKIITRSWELRTKNDFLLGIPLDLHYLCPKL